MPAKGTSLALSYMIRFSARNRPTERLPKADLQVSLDERVRKVLSRLPLSKPAELAIGRLQVPLEDVKRLDLFLLDARGEPHIKLQNIPFNRTVGGTCQ